MCRVSTMNCTDEEELQLTKTHMVTQQRPLPLTHNPILPSEFKASIKRLKHNKALGEDNITGGILQDGGEAMIQVLTDLFNTSASLPGPKNITECSNCL